MENDSDFKSASDDKFTVKEMDILEKNKKFFSTNRKYVDSMLEIINGESEISIRVLDWFVANYSKKNNTFYKIKNNGRDEFFYVNNEYKNQLNGYSKMYFDPFCRKKKVIYSYKSDDKSRGNNDPSRGNNDPADLDINFLSSIGQLNFFQWAIRFKIIVYVRLHISEIEEDMKETSKKNREKKLAALKEAKNIKPVKEPEYHNDEPDPVICSSDKINSFYISPVRKIPNRTDSDNYNKRQQLSKSVYEFGIKKSNIPIKLDFE
jgi:hypothetical protein